MGRRTFMVIAGEASGDMLAAELVMALREKSSAEGEETAFLGVGGSRMAEAGVEILFDLAANAVFGTEVFKRIFEFRRRFQTLLQLAIQREPDAIICVDFAGFNRRFAHAIKQHVRMNPGGAWKPKVIQYVSPQVWASRPGRANKLAQDVDLLLTIFPFEKAWYARRVPKMRVEFVGHPVVDRFAAAALGSTDRSIATPARLVLLPGSRPSELKRHLPILASALELIRRKQRVSVTMVLPETLIELAKNIGIPPDVQVQSNGLAEVLAQADAAIAKSGTVTLECAFLRVPTVTLYKTSWLTYEIARRIVSVKWITMANILADEEVFPEFVQKAATPHKIAAAALEFLSDSGRRKYVKSKLNEIVASLGERGATGRAAEAILDLLPANGGLG